jgi:ATP-dependent DNA ligase
MGGVSRPTRRVAAAAAAAMENPTGEQTLGDQRGPRPGRQISNSASPPRGRRTRVGAGLRPGARALPEHRVASPGGRVDDLRPVLPRPGAARHRRRAAELQRAVDPLPTGRACSGGCLYEPTWDGFRCIAVVDDDRGVQVGSRRSKRLNEGFPAIVVATGWRRRRLGRCSRRRGERSRRPRRAAPR